MTDTPESRGVMERAQRAAYFGLCPWCGKPADLYRVFLLDITGVLTRRTPELPFHRPCSALAVAAAGRPGVWAGYHVSHPLRPAKGQQWEWQVGHPYRVDWWTEGRAATRAEVLAGVETGLPELRKLCDTPADHAALDRAVKLAAEFFPAA